MNATATHGARTRYRPGKVRESAVLGGRCSPRENVAGVRARGEREAEDKRRADARRIG